MEVDLAPHPVVDPVFQVGDAERFSQALGSGSLNLLFFLSLSRVSKQGPCFTVTEEDGGTNFPFEHTIFRS